MVTKEKVSEAVCPYMVKMCNIPICGLVMSPCEVDPQSLCERVHTENAEEEMK